MSRTMLSHRNLLRGKRRARIGVELLESRTLLAANLATGIIADQLLHATVEIQVTIVSADNPANHVVPAGSPFDGVGRIEVRTATGTVLGFASGTLIAGGAYVLTAAHVVADASQAILSWPNGGISSVSSSEFFVHPGWNDNPLDANDIALIKLPTPITTLPSYNLYRDTAEVGKAATITGYGLSGVGQTGYVNGTYGTLRKVENRLDDTYTPNSALPRAQHPMLAFDFDSGSFLHDTIGLFFGIRDRGLGSAREGMIAPGDSGGATFLNVGGEWQVAGVNSFLLSFGSIFDSSRGVNSSYGELGFVTRVSAYDDWVDSVVAGSVTSTAGAVATSTSAPADTSPGSGRRVRLPDGTFITISNFDLTAVPPPVQLRTEVITFLVPPTPGLPPNLPTALRNPLSDSGTLVAGQAWYSEQPTPVTDDVAVAMLDAFWQIYGGQRLDSTQTVTSSAPREQAPPPPREDEDPPPMDRREMDSEDEQFMDDSDPVSFLLNECDDCVLVAAHDSQLDLYPAVTLAAVTLAVGSWRHRDGERNRARDWEERRAGRR